MIHMIHIPFSTPNLRMTRRAAHSKHTRYSPACDTVLHPQPHYAFNYKKLLIITIPYVTSRHVVHVSIQGGQSGEDTSKVCVTFAGQNSELRGITSDDHCTAVSAEPVSYQRYSSHHDGLRTSTCLLLSCR